MKKIKIILMLLALMLMTTVLYPSRIVLAEEINTPTQAEIDEMFQSGYAVRSNQDIVDDNLYAYLLDIAQEAGYTGNTLYSKIFDNEYFQLSSLDLSNKNISTLEGLEHFQMTKLKKIDLSYNNISTFDIDYFEKVNKSSVTHLNFANNKLIAADLTSFTGLEYVNFSSNSLSQIDLSNVTSSSLQIEVANNKFDSISDIKLPLAIDSINLNIIANNITDITDDYFELTKLKMNIGVQGVKYDNLVLDTASVVKFYKTNIENCLIKIYDISSLAVSDIKTITDADIDDTNKNCLEVQLPIGKYQIIYYIGNAEVYDQFDYNKAYFLKSKLDIIPTKPNYEYEFRGVRSKTLGKVTGKVTVHLSAEKDAVLYYQVNGGEWIEGNTVYCDKGGSYSILAKAVKEGVESKTQSIYVKTSLNTVVSDGLMFILLLFFALVLFLVVVPIISKKFFKK